MITLLVCWNEREIVFVLDYSQNRYKGGAKLSGKVSAVCARAKHVVTVGIFIGGYRADVER